MALKLPRRRIKALQFERESWRCWLKALEGRQLSAGDLTADTWPDTGQKVRGRTRHKNTYTKTYVRTHHNENYSLVTVLH